MRVAARAHIVADGELLDASSANVLAAAYPAIAYMEMRGDLMRPLVEGIGVYITLYNRYAQKLQRMANHCSADAKTGALFVGDDPDVENIESKASEIEETQAHMAPSPLKSVHIDLKSPSQPFAVVASSPAFVAAPVSHHGNFTYL